MTVYRISAFAVMAFTFVSALAVLLKGGALNA